MFEASHLQHNIVSGYIQIVSNGHHLPAFWAHPEMGGPFPGLVMLHDRWGLTAHVRAQARRFAEQGYYVIAPDLFNRQTASTDQQAEALIARVGEAAMSHVTTALNALKTHHRCDGRIGLVGWGMGGDLALRMAAIHEEPDAVVTFDSLPDAVTPAELRVLSCPLLAIFAGQDPHSPPERIDALRRTLEGAAFAHEVVRYPEARRGFFDDSRPAFDPQAAEDAWKRALAFLNANLEVEPPTSPRKPDPFEPGSVY